jgi:Zn-dependent protease/CBS domain-containing protein
MFNRSLTLGKLAGIDVAIDVSWLLIFGLLWWNLSAGVLPTLQPQLSGTETWVWAMVGTFLFFGSVLLHELAHALVARKQGIPVKGITLFLFGGVAQIEQEPKRAQDEFFMALAGPAMSVVLAVTYYLLAGTAFLPEAFVSVLLWLTTVNVILATFNLLPGFPLDGGRVFRALVWSITDNLRLATRIATLSGQVIGYSFVGIGVFMALGNPVPILGSGLIGGVWAAFIGLFLSQAATSAYQTQELTSMLSEVTAEELMRTEVAAVAPDLRVHDLLATHVKTRKERVFPVVEATKLLGTVDMRQVMQVPRDDWPTVTVAEIMTPIDKLTTLQPQTEAAQAVTILTRAAQTEVPVTWRQQLKGMISLRDIGLWLSLNQGFDSRELDLSA